VIALEIFVTRQRQFLFEGIHFLAGSEPAAYILCFYKLLAADANMTEIRSTQPSISFYRMVLPARSDGRLLVWYADVHHTPATWPFRKRLDVKVEIYVSKQEL
jgi:hypothetical protein